MKNRNGAVWTIGSLLESNICQYSLVVEHLTLFPVLEGVEMRTQSQFSQFSREKCSFEKNVRLQKIFRVQFSTKVVLMEIFVAIILKKLQRFESTANVKKKPCRSRLQNLRKKFADLGKFYVVRR